MHGSDNSGLSVTALFGFQDDRVVEIFAEDLEALNLVLPLASNAFDGLSVDACMIGKILCFNKDGICSASVRFEGDRESITQVFETVEKYGGWLRGHLDSSPETVPDATALALERGWIPGGDEENRPGGFGRGAFQMGFATAHAELTEESSEPDFEEDVQHEPTEENTEDDELYIRRWRKPLTVAVLLILALAVVGFLLLKFGIKGNQKVAVERGQAGSGTTQLEVMMEDPERYARHAMSIMQDSARLLPFFQETAIGMPFDSRDLVDWVSGSVTSEWNPERWKLGPDLEEYLTDPWKNTFQVRFDKFEKGTILRIWSTGPDGIDNDGKEDDVVAASALLAGSLEAHVSKTIDLLSSSVGGSDTAVGKWTKEGSAVVSPNEGGYAVWGFQVPLPDAYEVRFTVERRSGDHAFVIGFPARGKSVTALLDTPLQKGKDTIRGVGISHVIQRGTGNGNSPILPVGEKGEVYLRVSKDEIRTGINGSGEFSWKGHDEELRSFPKPFADNASGTPLFVGSWNSSFAIHDAKLISSESGPVPLPLQPPIDLPPAAEFPREGIVTLGWKDLGECAAEASDGARRPVSSSEGFRRIAVTLELGASEWTPSPRDLDKLPFPEGASKPEADRVEFYPVSSYKIRVGESESQATGVAWSSQPAATGDHPDLIGLGEPLTYEGSDDGKKWQIYQTGEMMIVHKTPINRSGRFRVTLWARFPNPRESGGVHVKLNSGEWMRVPDRAIIPLEFSDRSGSF